MTQILSIVGEWDDWAHKPDLTYIRLDHSPGHSVVLFMLYLYLIVLFVDMFFSF